MAPQPFYISVSKLAAAAGCHQYEPQEAVLAESFRKHFPLMTARLGAELREAPTTLVQEAVRAALASPRCADVHAEENAAKRARLTDGMAVEAFESLRPQLAAAQRAAEAASEAAASACAARAAEVAGLQAALVEKEAEARRASEADRPRAALALRAASESLEVAAAELAESCRKKAAAERKEAQIAAQVEEAPGLVRRGVASGVNTHRGSRDEPKVVAAAPSFEPGDGVMKYRRYVCGDHAFTLGGKYDGRRSDSGELVEAKARMRRFLGLPLYEEIQVLAYLYLFEAERCIHRESFAGEVRDTLVTRNDARLGALVREGLEELMRKWAQMQSDEAYRLEVLANHQPKQPRQ